MVKRPPIPPQEPTADEVEVAAYTRAVLAAYVYLPNVPTMVVNTIVRAVLDAYHTVPPT